MPEPFLADSPSSSAAPSRVPCARRLAAGLFCLLLALYTATFTGTPENPDSEVEFQTTSSLARRGRLDIGGTPEAEALVAVAAPGRPGRGFAVAPGGPGREDRSYSWFGVGQALAGLPFWWAGAALERLFPAVEEAHRGTRAFGVLRSEYFQHLLVGWRNPLFTALTASLVLLCAQRAGASARSALMAGLSYGIATFAWPQARSTLSDVQATLCLFAGFHALLLARARRRPLVSLAAAGLCLGLAFLTRVAVGPAVAFLGLAAALGVLFRARKQGPGRTLLALGALGLPFLACLGVFLATNLARFGEPLETGYGDVLAGGLFFSGSPLHGVLGLCFSPGKGLIWLAPGVLLAPLGALQARDRGASGLAVVIAGVALAVLAPLAWMQGWHGAWTYGPRYLLPLLPFVWVLVALALDARRAALPAVAARVVLWSGVVTSLPGVLVDYTTHHDLAHQAARLAWPEVAGHDEFQRDDDRYLRVQWDWRFAAPWAHWRILAHRAAGRGERFPVRSIFLLDDPAVLELGEERRRGLNHLAWVDLARRLGVSPWPAAALCLVLLGAGCALFLPRRREGGAQGPAPGLR